MKKKKREYRSISVVVTCSLEHELGPSLDDLYVSNLFFLFLFLNKSKKTHAAVSTNDDLLEAEMPNELRTPRLHREQFVSSQFRERPEPPLVSSFPFPSLRRSLVASFRELESVMKHFRYVIGVSWFMA